MESNMNEKFKRCKKCVMPNTRSGIKFNEEGICYPCLVYERREKIDWDKRWNELEQLCRLYRCEEGYDCVICISGGKDSHFQVGLLKEKLGMHPLCISVDNSSWSQTGRLNFDNINTRFDVDIITFSPAKQKLIDETRKDFFNELHPSKYWDTILYEKPMELAQKLGIELVFWGEDTNSLTGGEDWIESPDALKQSSKEVRKKFCNFNVFFLSYYVPWNRYDNLKYAKENGFKTLRDTMEWEREGLEGYEFEQVDTLSYLLNQVFKYIQFGFSNQTELGSDAIRLGLKTRKEVLKEIEQYEWKIDPYMVSDFCEGLNITRKEFFATIDKFANKELLYKDADGYWKLKEEYLK